MSTVLLVVNEKRPRAVALAATVRSWWESRGNEVVTAAEVGSATGELDLAISLGGDGTILRTVQLTLLRGTPVLGVNLGRMGFLAEVEPATLEEAFERIEKGAFRIDERMVLDVGLQRAGEVTTRCLAMNEVVVEKTAPGHTIRVEVAIAGKRFLAYVADGVLVCSPTGSTAYNLSARGPVVSPSLDALVVTPVAPHLVFDRSIVLAPGETVEMKLADDSPAAAVLDGFRVMELSVGDVVTCRGAAERARLVTFDEVHFHAMLRSRFGLADR